MFTGRYVKNPVNNETVPIWISDYVLMDYGTGAIMAVPAHDSRDYEFASAFNLHVRQVLFIAFNYYIYFNFFIILFQVSLPFFVFLFSIIVIE